MGKIYKIMEAKKIRTCNGCNRVIKRDSGCLYTFASFRGFPYKNYFHNKECLKKYGG